MSEQVKYFVGQLMNCNDSQFSQFLVLTRSLKGDLYKTQIKFLKCKNLNWYSPMKPPKRFDYETKSERECSILFQSTFCWAGDQVVQSVPSPNISSFVFVTSLSKLHAELSELQWVLLCHAALPVTPNVNIRKYQKKRLHWLLFVLSLIGQDRNRIEPNISTEHNITFNTKTVNRVGSLGRPFTIK